MELCWLSPQELSDAAAAAPWALSPWLVEQLAEVRDAEALARVAPVPAGS